jgi:hypothetical protein
MKLLLDECLPRSLKRALPGYDVSTVPEMGLAGIKNGQLLALMEPVFDVFITIDGNGPPTSDDRLTTTSAPGCDYFL